MLRQDAQRADFIQCALLSCENRSSNGEPDSMIYIITMTHVNPCLLKKRTQAAAAHKVCLVLYKCI